MTTYNHILELVKATCVNEINSKELTAKAVAEYCEISSYDEMKQVNKLIADVYAHHCLSAGIEEKVAKDRAYNFTAYLRRLAKKAGWKQPENPNSTAKEKPLTENSIKPFMVTRTVTDEQGNLVKAQVSIPDEVITDILLKVVNTLPKSVFSTLFDKTGNLRQSVRKTVEAEAVASETISKLESEVLSIIEGLKAKL